MSTITLRRNVGMTCVWYHFKPYDILFPKIHEPPKVKFSTLQPLCGGWPHIILTCDNFISIGDHVFEKTKNNCYMFFSFCFSVA